MRARVCRRVGAVLGVRAMAERRCSVILLVLASRASAGGGIGWGKHAKGRGRRTGCSRLWSERGGLGAGVDDLRRWWGGRLVASIVDNPREKILASARHFLYGFLGGAILARAARGLGGWKTWGRHWGQVVGLGGVAGGEVNVAHGGIAVAIQGLGAEYVG